MRQDNTMSRYLLSWTLRITSHSSFCFRMLFMTPVKPANNLASSPAASFFLVFLLLFSTPEAATLPPSVRFMPGTRQLGEKLHTPGTLGLVFTKHQGWGGGCKHSALERAGGATAVRLGGGQPAQKLAVRQCSLWAASPAELELEGGACGTIY